MSVTLRGRVVSFDNLSAGNASGQERTVGAAPPSEKVGGLDNISAGNAFPTAVIADNIVAGTTSPTREISK